MGKVRDSRIAEIVARNVRLIREAKGLTQKQLAERVQWRHQSMLTQIEKGHRGMGPQSLRKLAEALEVDPGFFYMENLREDATFTKKIVDIPKEESILFQLSFYNIDCRYLQEVHPDFIDQSIKLGTFPILKIHPFADKHRIVGAVVDTDNMIPEYNKGDIICTDLDDVDLANCDIETKYICRVKDINAIYNVITKGDFAELREIPPRDNNVKPFQIDVRIGKSSTIVGKVLWKLNLYY